MTRHNLNVEHAGRFYEVEVEVEWRKVDDSFDHEFGTQHLYHYEPMEWEVTSCLDIDDDDQVEPEHVPGLRKAIARKVDELEHPDQ